MEMQIRSGFCAPLAALFLFASTSFAAGQDRESLSFSGVYQVPTKDSGIDPTLAAFPVGSVDVKILNSLAKIEYSFPQALDGTGQRIELDGVVVNEGRWEFAGPHGTLRCGPIDSGAIECGAHYPGLQIDQPARDAYLRSISTSDAEFGGRGQVAQIFDGERIGVLTLRPAPPAP